MLNRKRIFAIVLFVLIGLFIYTFANPAEDLEPLDNNNNIEDVDKNKDNDKKDDVIQLPDEDDNNLVPVIVNAANYDVLRTAVANGNVVLNLETEDEGLNSLLDQLETATNNGQQIITNQINDQNLVNNGANAINALVTRINALLSENLEDAIEEGNRILNYYAEISNLNPNLQGLLNDLDDAIEGASDLESPDLQQILQDTIEILEIIIEIEEFQADLDIINSMSLTLVPNITNWTNKNIILTAEYDIENPDLIEGITIVRGSTCGPEEPLPQFSRVFENLVMTAVNTGEITVSENDDYTACVTFLNGELRSATYPVENIDKDKPLFESPLNKSHTKGNITISVIEDNLKEIKVWNQDTNTTTIVANGSELSSEATYRISVTDLANNKNEIWVAIDRTAPTISGLTDEERYNTDLTVNVFDKFLTSVSVTKDGTTVNYDRDDFTNNIKKEDYNLVLNLSDEGDYTITATDKVGISTTRSFTIDKTAPRVSVTYISNKDKTIEYNRLGDRVAIEFVSNEPLDLEKMNITIAGQTAIFDTDKPSVVNKYTYETFVKEDTINGQVEFVINVTDLAGNAIEPIVLQQKRYNTPINYTGLIVIDTHAPIIESIIKSTDAWTNGNVTLTVNATDNVNNIDINTIKYSFDNGVTYQEENTKTFTSNTDDIKVVVKDGAGNISEVETVSISNVDRDLPVITGVENNGLYNIDMTYNVTEVNIEKVIVDGIESSVLPADRTVTTEGTHTIQVIDKAGNSASVTFTIDKTLATVSSLTQQYEEGKIKVTVQYSEPVTGFLVGDNEWNNLGGNLYSKYYTGTQDVTIDFEDLAGNPNSYTFTVDNTAPVPTVRYTEITKENGESYDLLTGVSSDDSEATIVATVNGVEVTNSNQLSVGTHTINYTFTDAVGNYATATATITVKVDFTIELLPSGFLVSRRIAFTYWLGGYTINNVNLITPEGDELTLGNVETMWDLIYGRQRVVLTKDQYNQLDSGTYSIKVTYKNNWLNLDNLVMYYTFQ